MSRQTANQTQQKSQTAMPVCSGILQRKCACGNHTVSGGECLECAGKKQELQRRATSENGISEVPPIVHEVLRSPGQQLDKGMRDFFEPRFKHDFSRARVHTRAPKASSIGLQIGRADDHCEQEADRVADTVMRRSAPSVAPASALGDSYDFSYVRVHTDTQAAKSARAVNARAYTVGRDIVFGSGQYALETNGGKRLLAHELTHTIQQRAGLTGLALQRDVIDDVREKLSYGFLDWAITDAEAMESLALLETIPAANLGNALTRLGSKYVTRLLDNLPDAAKTGEVYKRVIEALGPAGVAPYVTEQLSYGLFDWAITDAEVTRVFNTFVNLPTAVQEQFLVDLNAAGRLRRLISNANTGHHALYIRPWIATLAQGGLNQRQRQILRTIVAETSNDAIETLKLATETRFNVTVGRTTIPGRAPVEWDPSLMREAYLALDELPEAHVAKNKELLRFGQFRQAASGGFLTAGVYRGAQRELAINIEASDIRDDIVHETAHAVDEEMGWSTGPEPAKPKRGGWKTYGAGYNNCAGEMVDDSGGVIKTTLSPPQRGDVVNEMATAMGNRNAQGLERDIRNLAWFAGLAAATKRAVLADRAINALGIGLNRPWFNATDGGEHLADHVYQESYSNTWVRYRHEARSRKVSPYQFRDPGEWFAEAYAFYYKPDPRGRGAKLADKDPDTKVYFDTDIHTRAPSR